MIMGPPKHDASLSVTDYSTPSAQWSAALWAQQLPPICQFTGEEVTDGREMLTDYTERLEMVAIIIAERMNKQSWST